MEVCVSTSDDIRDLVGTKFTPYGRTPESGFDCWGLVMYCYSLEGIELPDYTIDPMDSKSINKTARNEINARWDRVAIDEVEYLDVVAIRLDPRANGFVTHAGLCLDEKDFIHAMEKTHTIISRLNHAYWKPTISGIYRLAR